MKYLAFFILFISHLQAQASVDRVEPPFWYTGMKNSTFQLCLYGENVGKTTLVKVNHPDVILDRSVTTENDHYLFLYLSVSDRALPGQFTIDLQNHTGSSSFSYELKERKPDSAQRKGFSSADVVYLITPDRFANGDLTNDVNPTMLDQVGREDKFGRHGGDIQGIIDHLDYLQDLGITSIWLNPVLENDMKESSYHGYAITDFYKTDPRYGSNDLYLQLVQECQERGIGVIMDMVMNHCGSQHWFVLDPPTPDWINYGGEYVNTNHRRHVNQDPYASESDKNRFSDGWFVRSMPDLNQNNPLLADYLIQNSLWWIEYSGIHGIRMDTHPYPDKYFMSRWSCTIMDEYPFFNLVGEEWSPQPAIIAYWQEDKLNHDQYISCMPSMMDFPLQIALKESMNRTEKNWESGMVPLYETLALDFLYAHPDQLMVFADNHDMDRWYSQVDKNLQLFKIGLAYLLTTRGVPQIYYGTEVLLDNSEHPDDHGIIRTDFPGGWPGDQINGFTQEGLTADQIEAQEYLKRLLNWRKEKEVIHHGNLKHFAPKDGIYTLFRYDEKEVIMIVLNKNKDSVRLNTDHYDDFLTGVDKVLNICEKDPSWVEVTAGEIIVPGLSAAIFELRF